MYAHRHLIGFNFWDLWKSFMLNSLQNCKIALLLLLLLLLALFFQYVFCPLLSIFSIWGPYNEDIRTVDVVSGFPKPLSFKKVSFFFLLFWFISTSLESRSLLCSSVSSNMMLIPFGVFFLYFSYYTLQFWLVIFSKSLLKFLLSFSILLSLVSVLKTFLWILSSD